MLDKLGGSSANEPSSISGHVDEFLHKLDDGIETPCLIQMTQAARNMLDVKGFEFVTEYALTSGAQSPPPNPVNLKQCVVRLSSCQLCSGHHRAPCARVGVLGRRGHAVKNVAARICREAGGRGKTHGFVRDLDVDLPRGGDGRRLEVVVDGLPLFGGAQLAVDTTLVSTLHDHGTVRRRAADEDGVALAVVRRTKEARYPELVGPRARAWLVVMGVEIGGRRSCKTQRLVRAKGKCEVWLLRCRAEQT